MTMRMEICLKRGRTKRERCMEYIRMTVTLQDAQALAKKEGFVAKSRTWLHALSDVLGGRFYSDCVVGMKRRRSLGTCALCNKRIRTYPEYIHNGGRPVHLLCAPKR